MGQNAVLFKHSIPAVSWKNKIKPSILPWQLAVSVRWINPPSIVGIIIIIIAIDCISLLTSTHSSLHRHISDLRRHARGIRFFKWLHLALMKKLELSLLTTVQAKWHTLSSSSFSTLLTRCSLHIDIASIHPPLPSAIFYFNDSLSAHQLVPACRRYWSLDSNLWKLQTSDPVSMQFVPFPGGNSKTSIGGSSTTGANKSKWWLWRQRCDHQRSELAMLASWYPTQGVCLHWHCHRCKHGSLIKGSFKASLTLRPHTSLLVCAQSHLIRTIRSEITEVDETISSSWR